MNLSFSIKIEKLSIPLINMPWGDKLNGKCQEILHIICGEDFMCKEYSQRTLLKMY